MLQFRHAIGWIDVDQNQPSLGSGELNGHPFGAVRGPDPQPVSRLEAQGQEPGGERVRLSFQLGVCPTDSLLDANHRFAGALLRHNVIEKGANRRRNERRSYTAMYVTEGVHRTASAPVEA